MDFVAQPSTAVPFPPGSNQTGVTVEIVDDSQVEMTESFTVSLSLPPTSIGLKLGAQTTATVIIFDSGRIIHMMKTPYLFDHTM